MSTRILLVEDEAHLARGLAFNFEAEGYEVSAHERGETALEYLLSPDGRDVDLVVLDVMLPGMSGFDVLERLRGEEASLPVLLLTARDTDVDIVRGLDMGADDYLTKPFSLPVLMARVRTLLRRSSNSDGGAEPIRIGEVVVHPDRFELSARAGEPVGLTAKELALLRLLWERRGRAVSRGEILEEVWDLHPETRTRVVDTFVSRLRKLIEPDPSKPTYLLSVRSFGYRLVVD